MNHEKTWDLCPLCCLPVQPELTHNGIANVYHVVHCGWGHEMGVPQMDEREAWKASAITLREVLRELTGEIVSALRCINAAESMLSLVRHRGIRPALSDDKCAPDKNQILEVEVQLGALLKKWENITKDRIRW